MVNRSEIHPPASGEYIRYDSVLCPRCSIEGRRLPPFGELGDRVILEPTDLLVYIPDLECPANDLCPCCILSWASRFGWEHFIVGLTYEEIHACEVIERSRGVAGSLP